jgi:hypothetical protein
MGIEPTLFAWEARVLPLNDTRMGMSLPPLDITVREFTFDIQCSMEKSLMEGVVAFLLPQ